MDGNMKTETALSLVCPMCCSKSFESRQELVDHLSQLMSQISCPICKQSYESIQMLIDHLNLGSCYTLHTSIVFENEDTQSSVATVQSFGEVTETQNEKESNANEIATINFKSTEGLEDNAEVSNMYAELLSKHLTKADWQAQEVKLVQENGENRYIFLSENGVGLDSDTVVTKNNDGTISLRTLEDMKVEATETAISQDKEQPEAEEESRGIYSCNTCGISFTSVMEHIQNYHNDQEVVVEEPIDENSEDYETPVDSVQTPKRVITDTGDIVEAVDQIPVLIEPTLKVKEEVGVPKQQNGRFIKVDQLCDSVVKNINENDNKNSMCHKVVMQSVKGSTSKVFHCIHCKLLVSTLSKFKSKPCKKLSYKCLQCPVIYNNPKSLCAHMKVHKVLRDEIEEPVQYKCEVCNTTFLTNKSLKLHRRMHEPLKARPIEGPVTGEGGPNTTDMFLCSVCDKLIPVDYRTIHQNSHHKDNDKLNCDICNKKFTSAAFLEMHMNVHNMDRVTFNNPDKQLPYNCLYCHRKFSRPHEKVKHERIHTGEKPHSCEICGKSFRVSYCLTLHMRTHTGARPYACPHCPKRFKAHSVYNHHILTHSEVRAYKCPFCPKAFKTSVQLAGHKNSHTKPFACQQCNRPFASLYAVRVHTETHNKVNNLKFSCAQCGASYARASALKDHTKQAHGIDDSEQQSFKDDWIIEIDNSTQTSSSESQPLLTEKDSTPIANETWLNCS